MKVITIYELMGLIKDGQAPKKIKYKNIIYYLTEDIEYRDRISSNLLLDIYGNTCSILDFLNDTVEILSEENDEWEDMEEMTLSPKNISLTNVVLENRSAINQLVKNQKYLKERLDKNELE